MSGDGEPLDPHSVRFVEGGIEADDPSLDNNRRRVFALDDIEGWEMEPPPAPVWWSYSRFRIPT